MKILILGAGKMGAFFIDLLSFDHEVAVYDANAQQLRFIYNCRRFSTLEEVREFEPDMVINAVTIRYTIDAFRSVLPLIPKECTLSDIASVKTGLPEFYADSDHPFVSTHPMFGPTFASLSNLQNENAIIISESSESGKEFFRQLYSRLGLHIEEYTFDEHDETIAYSLTVPFASTLAFASAMKHQSAPGTTFKRHMAIARGLMSEDDYLLSEILFNPRSPKQLDRIISRLTKLRQIVAERNVAALNRYLESVRENLK